MEISSMLWGYFGIVEKNKEKKKKHAKID